jgi:hypothetical protein
VKVQFPDVTNWKFCFIIPKIRKWDFTHPQSSFVKIFFLTINTNNCKRGNIACVHICRYKHGVNVWRVINRHVMKKFKVVLVLVTKIQYHLVSVIINN